MKQHPVTITADQLSRSNLGDLITVNAGVATITAKLQQLRVHTDDTSVRIGLLGLRGPDSYALWPLDPNSEVIVQPAAEEAQS